MDLVRISPISKICVPKKIELKMQIKIEEHSLPGNICTNKKLVLGSAILPSSSNSADANLCFHLLNALSMVKDEN